MAVITITPANVIVDTNQPTSQIIVGESVTAGDILYYKPSDAKWWKADNATAEKAGSGAKGNIKMALGAGSANQKIVAADPGALITVGAVLVKTDQYVLSSTSAKMELNSDMSSADLFTSIGYGFSTTQLYFDPNPTGLVR